MEAGRLRHQITIQTATQTQDATTGELVTTWQTLGTCRAAVEPLKGREAIFGNQVIAEMDTRIIVRWSNLTSQITALHRIVHQGFLFNVVSVANLKMGQREIEIMAKSGVNDG